MYGYCYSSSASQSAEFCVVVRRGHLGPPELLDALRVGCIPVVAADLYVLPFSEVLDWTRIGLHVYEQDLAELAGIIKGTETSVAGW